MFYKKCSRLPRYFKSGAFYLKSDRSLVGIYLLVLWESGIDRDIASIRARFFSGTTMILPLPLLPGSSRCFCHRHPCCHHQRLLASARVLPWWCKNKSRLSAILLVPPCFQRLLPDLDAADQRLSCPKHHRPGALLPWSSLMLRLGHLGWQQRLPQEQPGQHSSPAVARVFRAAWVLAGAWRGASEWLGHQGSLVANLPLQTVCCPCCHLRLALLPWPLLGWPCVP